MKSAKGDGAKYIQSRGSLATIETGPLFPRLHVNDTEKAGPRAPPRNKMALYEQFTVPSHRFVPASRTQMASVNAQQQIGPNDYGYPYFSYYVPSSVPYTNMNYGVQSHTQPSFGMGSCVTSSSSALVCKQELQKTLESQSACVGASRVVAKKGSCATTAEYNSEPKSQDMSVENASQKSPCNDEPQKLASAGRLQKRCDRSDSIKLGEGPSAMDITEELQQALSNVEAVLECTMSANKHNCETSIYTEIAELEKITEGNDIVQSNGPTSSEGPSERTDGMPPAPVEQTVQQPVSQSQPGKVVFPDSLRLANDTPQVEDGRASTGHMATEEEPTPLVEAFGRDMLQTTPKEEVLGTFSLRKDTCPPDDGKGQTENKQMNVNHVSRPSQASLRGGPHCSPFSVEAAISTHEFRPKDVIRAVGQQQFWKARKALLRQQRIFSDQVFQLHKLIKVQQLLAETPGTLIDDEMAFGTMGENDASPLHQSLSEGEFHPNEEGNNRGPSFEARDEEQAHLGGTYSGNFRTSEHVAVGNAEGSTPFMPTPGPGGISAWGYPSQGIGQWMGPVPAPGGPFAYQPITGTFPLGPPYGGLYGMPMSGTLTPLMPFGIPFSGQGNELWEEVSSNHGPAAAHIQQSWTALGHMASHTSNNLARRAWPCLQYNNAHYSQGFYADGSSKEVPAGSVASINNQKAVKAPFAPSRMQHPLGVASHSIGFNENGCEQSIHQGESFVPSIATRQQLKPSAPVPSMRKAYRDVEQLDQHPDTGTRRPQGSLHSEADRTMGKAEPDNRLVMSLKRGQNGQVASTGGGVEEISVGPLPSEHSENVLDLFPQVSSGLPVSWKQERLAEEQQSRVIKAVPRPAVAASRSTAGILLSLQRERHR